MPPFSSPGLMTFVNISTRTVACLELSILFRETHTHLILGLDHQGRFLQVLLSPSALYRPKKINPPRIYCFPARSPNVQKFNLKKFFFNLIPIMISQSVQVIHNFLPPPTSPQKASKFCDQLSFQLVGGIYPLFLSCLTQWF